MNGDEQSALQHFLADCQQRMEQVLQAALPPHRSPFSDEGEGDNALQRLLQAMRYSLLNGGKRVRPALVFAAAAAAGGDTRATALERIAAALEMIHAYSLIHDDLPAMDDDDLRRGQPTCHRAFDEATAILAGDALQARAFELLTDLPDTDATVALTLLRQLALASGSQGMVGGQAIDLGAVDRHVSLPHLEQIHRLKTGALIRAAVGMGALFAGASDAQQRQLDRYAEAIGLAFQVQDDILDIEGDTATIGKTRGADQARNKPTYPSLLGLEGAHDMALGLHRQAVNALAGFDQRADTLRALSGYIIDRRH